MHPFRTMADLATRHARVTSVAGVTVLALVSGGVAFAATRGSDDRVVPAAVSLPINPATPGPATTAPTVTTPTTTDPETIVSVPPTTAPTTTTTSRPTPGTVIRTREVGHVLRGTVSAVDAGRWTVTTDKGVAVTVLVTSRTAFGNRTDPTTAAVFPVGTSVTVLGWRMDGVVTASRIRPPPPPHPRRPPTRTPVTRSPPTSAPTTAPAAAAAATTTTTAPATTTTSGTPTTAAQMGWYPGTRWWGVSR
jgi:hypothetical protein